MESLDGLDSAFLALETPTSQFHIAAALVLDPVEGKRSLYSPSTRFAQIRRLVAQRVTLVPAFRQRVVPVPFGLGHPVWVDDPKFDLDDHLTRASLPTPGGMRELDRFVAQLVGRPLHRDRPLWEMVVVEGLEGERTAVVVKLHHAILDGVSGASLLAAFFDLGPRGQPTAIAPSAWEPPPLPSTGELLRRSAASLPRQPTAVLAAWRRSIPLVAAAAERRAGAAAGVVSLGVPRTPFNGTLSPHRRYAAVEVPLESARRIRHAWATTINDVILACVGEAMRRMLEDRGQLPARPLVAMVPVSTRSEGDTGLGNRISAMLVSLATDIPDPVERLWAIAESSRAAKARLSRTEGRILADVAEGTAPAITSSLARWTTGLKMFDRLPPLANVVVSSVPGPSFPLWCAGGKVVGLRPMGPVAHGIGLNVTAFSYQQTLCFGLLGCRRLVPDLEDLALHVEGAMDRLMEVTERAQAAAG